MRHALRRLAQAFAAGIVPRPGDERADGLLGFGAARPFDLLPRFVRQNGEGRSLASMSKY
jgi:hypothetical protein